MKEVYARAWDNANKVMIEEDYVRGVDSYGELVVTQFHSSAYGPTCPELILMQWIGLRDNNNIKVYDGDIFTSKRYPFQDEGVYNYHGVVEWFEDNAAFGYCLKLVNKNKGGISDGICELFEGKDGVLDIEVIGNIYENPELLEEV